MLIQNDLYENALANIQDEVGRRQEIVRHLNEYGIFLMQKGVNQDEF
jgi:hypothetical protein